MKKFLVLLYLFAVVVSSNNLSAQSMRILILADDQDKDIGKAVQKNIYNFEYAFSKIAESLNTPVYITKLTSESLTLTRNHIMAWIRHVKPSPTDIIVIYYSGHGLRSTDTISRWPAGHVPNEKRNVMYVDFGKIIKKIIHKNAGLNLILLDCCNVTAQPWPLISKEITPYAPFDVKNINISSRKNSLVKLFKLKGFVIASGSSPNEVSWANYSKYCPEWPNIYENPSAGSVFSKFFLHNLLVNNSTLNGNFSSILHATKQDCLRETQNKKDYRIFGNFESLLHSYQTPQFKVCLHKQKKNNKIYKHFIFSNTKNSELTARTNDDLNSIIECDGQMDTNFIFLTPSYSLLNTTE